MSETRRLVFDTRQMRPACVLLQAAMGGDSSAVSGYFAAEIWLTDPTENMEGWSISEEDLRQLADAVNKHHKAGTLGQLAERFRAAREQHAHG